MFQLQKWGNMNGDDILLILYILKKIMIAECQCQNGLDGNVCDVTTGACGLCKPGFFGDFCQGK